MLDTHKIIVVTFLIIDKANQIKLLKEIFLMTNINLEVFFRILFLILSGANIDFLDWEL